MGQIGNCTSGRLNKTNSCENQSMVHTCRVHWSERKKMLQLGLHRLSQILRYPVVKFLSFESKKRVHEVNRTFQWYQANIVDVKN